METSATLLLTRELRRIPRAVQAFKGRLQAGRLTALSGCPQLRLFCSQCLPHHQALTLSHCSSHLPSFASEILPLAKGSLLSSQNISQVCSSYSHHPSFIQDLTFFFPGVWHKPLAYLLGSSLAVPREYFAEDPVVLCAHPCWELWAVPHGLWYEAHILPLTRDQHLALTYLFELIISFQHGTLCILKSLTISFISNANSHCFIVLYSQSPTLYLVSSHNANALLVWNVRIRFICCTHKDLSMALQLLCRKPGAIIRLCYPVLSEAEAKIDGSRALLTSLFSWNGERLCLEK